MVSAPELRTVRRALTVACEVCGDEQTSVKKVKEISLRVRETRVKSKEDR